MDRNNDTRKIDQVINQCIMKLENHKYDKPVSYTLSYNGNNILSDATFPEVSQAQLNHPGPNNDLFKIVPNF